MKPETKLIMKPIPEGLDCGNNFSDEEMAEIRMLREIIKTSEWDRSLCCKFYILISKWRNAFFQSILCWTSARTTILWRAFCSAPGIRRRRLRRLQRRSIRCTSSGWVCNACNWIWIKVVSSRRLAILSRSRNYANDRVSNYHISRLNNLQKDYPKYIPREPLCYFDDFIKTNCKAMLKHRDRQGRRIYLCKLGE